jgi:hypothetical protein
MTQVSMILEIAGFLFITFGTHLENAGSGLGRYHLGLSDVGPRMFNLPPDDQLRYKIVFPAKGDKGSSVGSTSYRLQDSAGLVGGLHWAKSLKKLLSAGSGSGPYQFKTQLNTPQPRAKLLGRLRV